MKRRIVKINYDYYPQYKLIWWHYYWYYTHMVGEYDGGFDKISFYSRSEAIKFLKEKKEPQEKPKREKKIKKVVWSENNICNMT